MNISKKTQVLIATIIIMAVSAYPIYWLIQNQINPGENPTPTFRGNREIGKDYIRFWTDVEADSWSGMKTVQEWSFATNLWLKAQLRVTSLGSPSFYTEIILVNEGEVDEGFGFQLTYASPDHVRIKGWSWTEETESFSYYTDKPINVVMNLEARKISTNQIDFYVDDALIGSIETNIPYQEGVMNLDLTNGSQGGFSEVFFNYQVQ